MYHVSFIYKFTHIGINPLYYYYINKSRFKLSDLLEKQNIQLKYALQNVMYVIIFY